MTVQLDDLLEGAKVSVTWNKEDEQVTKEGSVVAANEAMLLIKPRGAMLGELIHAANIVSITELTEISKILVRKLRIVKMSEARQHLADRHGYPIESPYLDTESAAFKHHETLDHENLSHLHEDKDESARAEAIEQASQNGQPEGDED